METVRLGFIHMCVCLSLSFHVTVPVWKVPNNTESQRVKHMTVNVGGLIMVGKDGWLAEIPYQV